ncbi:DUF5655 domain-containing protein [Aestuariirhabdus litorea]|uniref:DUF91 domain-containing protein n=1 Tax=Aestuariirhabdus litorea TaxID=2528527 RepID=A0A3P3VP60_9GAMM|nr:DUF5655 domain-containing protein [Aestuariirhabdus litorea]RRJ82603.1 DUF91 domain-containing protein [Aestuariirhabdus litorea]RWW92762.1 DUF91 domain-containing protein [Endozoicomonadaceae bacterium GTF-13]
MSDAKLYRFNGEQAEALPSRTAKLEKELQALIEGQMEVFLGVRFLATEYSTGKTHKGRIDSLGLDENGCPVIIEYKRHSNENVINQGLFYLDWLLDHQAEFRWLVMETFGKETAEAIEWSGTRLICIASDFNKYDEHAVQQINRNIELVRYRYFGEDLLLLDLVNAQTASGHEAVVAASHNAEPVPGAKWDWTHKAALEVAPAPLKALYDELCDYADSLGDEVQRKELKLYTAFKRIRNFACITLNAKSNPKIILMLALSPTDVDLEEGFSRDMREIGHWGTGDLELTIRTAEDLEKAKPLIERSYQQG